jgi:hypothetical protein
MPTIPMLERLAEALPLRPGGGRLPGRVRASVAWADEDILLVEEGLSTSVTGRRVRRWGEYTMLLKEYGRGAIVIIDRQLVVLAANGAERLRVRHPQGEPPPVTVTAEGPDRLCLAYDASYWIRSTASSGKRGECRSTRRPSGGGRRPS